MTTTPTTTPATESILFVVAWDRADPDASTARSVRGRTGADIATALTRVLTVEGFVPGTEVDWHTTIAATRAEALATAGAQLQTGQAYGSLIA